VDTYALNQSLEFIRASINTFDTSGFICRDGLKPEAKGKLRNLPVIGVVGGSYSSVSMQVANLLRLFGIPQVSPASTSPSLSDKSRYELFARTVPPDTYQAMAIVDIVQAFNWSYVSTISSEGSYGEAGIDAFQRVAAQRNVCIAVSEKIPHTVTNNSVFIDIVKSLSSKHNARAVVVFTRMEDARLVYNSIFFCVYLIAYI
jgi:metabotropic glutamate receptor 2/3